jgi:thiol-disulfide isomerase/thioredoxin
MNDDRFLFVPPNGRRHALRHGVRGAVGLLALGALGGVAAAPDKTPGEVAVGEALRDTTLQGLNGPPRKLAQFRGRPLIINVWASWCGPCRAEMASLERLAWREPAGQFALIGISTDDYPERAKAFMQQSNATISHFIDRELQMETMLGAKAIPLTVLVDANGRVVEKVYGAKQWDGPEALALIARAFRNPKIAGAR